jgi:hypothetical protein
LAVLVVVLLVLIVVALWRQVQSHLDKAEAKLLLNRNPDEPMVRCWRLGRAQHD